MKHPDFIAGDSLRMSHEMSERRSQRLLQRMSARLACLAVLASLGACAVTAPPSASVTSDMPVGWSESTTNLGALPAPDWWLAFNSPELSRLINAALAGSPELGIAAERVRQAEAQVQIAGASLFPVLGLSAGAGRRESGADGVAGASSASLGLSASYEVDLWGQNRSAQRSSEFSLRATRFDQQTIRLTLVTGVASAYFQILSLRGRLQTARDNLAIAERVQKVVESRARYGAASKLDVTRQQSAVLSQQAAIPPLELQERQTLFALALLVGSPPQGFAVSGVGVLDLPLSEVSPGLPSSLLLRRPDLASSEAQLAAANANIAVARAALLPGIQLTGSAGFASSSLTALVSGSNLAMAIGASLVQSIFDGGRLRAQLVIAGARERELTLAYRRSILASLVDVENALAASSRNAQQEALLMQSAQQAAEALRLAEVRYREGADDLIVLLDAQRTLFQSQDQVAQIRLARLRTQMDLIKALGGGWETTATRN